MIEGLLQEGTKVVDSYSIRIPTYVDVSKKTSKAVNLNIYRNLHHHHLNNQKQNFHDEVKPLLRGKPKASRIWIHYQIFAPRKGRLDTMNVGSVVDKYFSDTLVEAQKIPDDDYSHIILSTFSFGGICPMDGHAIATVYILEKDEEKMRVMLDQEDIETALNAYVKTLNLPNATGVDLSVNSQGDIEAEILMNDVKPKSRGGRPRGSKNKRTSTAKESSENDVNDVETDTEDSGNGTDSGRSDASENSPEEGEAEPQKTKEGQSETANPSSTEDSLFSDSGEKEVNHTSPEVQETDMVTPPKTNGSTKTHKSIFDD